VSFILARFHSNLDILTGFIEKAPSFYLTKTILAGAELFHVNSWTDRSDKADSYFPLPFERT
jgi:hypothetical protein